MRQTLSLESFLVKSSRNDRFDETVVVSLFTRTTFPPIRPPPNRIIYQLCNTTTRLQLAITAPSRFFVFVFFFVGLFRSTISHRLAKREKIGLSNQKCSVEHDVERFSSRATWERRQHPRLSPGDVPFPNGTKYFSASLSEDRHGGID